MSDIEQDKGINTTGPNAEQHIEEVAEVTTEEMIGSVALTVAETSEQIVALDEQVPRSWDLHKCGW